MLPPTLKKWEQAFINLGAFIVFYFSMFFDTSSVEKGRVDALLVQEKSTWIIIGLIIIFIGSIKILNTIKIEAFISLGVFIVFYYLMFFDTSVKVPSTYIMGLGYVGGGRVNNIGLMHDRQIGIIIGIFIIFLGAFALIFFKRKNKYSSVENKILIPKNNVSNLCIECGKYFENFPQFCPNCGKITKFKNQSEST